MLLGLLCESLFCEVGWARHAGKGPVLLQGLEYQHVRKSVLHLVNPSNRLLVWAGPA